MATWSSAARLSILSLAVFVTGSSLALGNKPGDNADAKTTLASTWAHVEVKGGYPEGASMPGLFGAVSENLSTGLGRLKKAATDDQIGGVILRIKSPSLGWAKLHEFRQVVAALKKAGKKVVAVVDDAGTQDYLLAAACDEIIMPEGGSLMMVGLRMEVTFYKNLFDLIGVKADMMQVGEYKGAAEPYSRTEMSAAYREEMEAVLDDYYDLIVTGVAEARGLDREKVIAAIDSGPHTARAAKELGLIDRLAYEDEVKTILNKEFAGKKLVRGYGKQRVDTDFSGLAGMMKMMNLMMGVEPRRRASNAPKIAVVHATGMIMTGRSMNDPFGGQIVGSETLVSAIRKAEADDTVKAIVLRVDSPGGSALASDLIWRALKKCQKPVVASMGNTAASGGYYISMGAKTVFAEPGTLTGSIGVVGGKIAIGGVFNKVGVTTTVLKRGKNSGTLSSLEPFSDSERAAMMKLMKEIYDQFTTKVADARGMELEALEKLARGRVYTGKTALKLKLVDQLGTLDDAVAKAKELAGLKAEDKVERMILPKATSPFEALFGPIDAQVQTPAGQASRQAFLQALQSVSPELAREWSALSVLQLLSRERRMTILPYRITVH